MVTEENSVYWISEGFSQDWDLYNTENLLRHLAMVHCEADSVGEDWLWRAVARLERRRMIQSFRPNIAVDKDVYLASIGPLWNCPAGCP